LGAGGGRFRGGGTLLHDIEQALLDFIDATYGAIGWPGVILLMALETVVFPIPSEIVMPLAGKEFIADQGRGWYWIIPAGIFGAIGSTLGALGIYYVAKVGGQPFLRRYGKWVLVSRNDLDQADRFFNRWGPFAVFFGRMVPLVRSLVSVPAGLVNMPLPQFLFYTFLGSFVWATGLAYGGFKLGENYEDLRNWMEPLDYPIAAILALGALLYIYIHVKDAWFSHDGGHDAADRAKGTS
jgi:membrane protein DedA with SNARE-associated domain